MRTRLVLLTGQTITLGLMIAFLVVPASALFLSRYGAGGLPYAYLAVAASGVLVSAVIRRAQARHSLVVVALAVLTAYLLLVAAGWLILTTTDVLWVTFPLLVLFPLSIPLGFLIVGGQAGRLLDVRELKAHLPRVVAGFSVGFGIASLTSAWLAPVLGGPAQLLGLSVCATLVMIILVATTARRYSATLRTRPVRPSPPSSAGTRARAGLLRNPLVLTLFGYQLLSSAVSQLLDYIVWERAAARYPDPVGLTRFMGLFGVIINIVTIVFVAVFAGRLLTRFGVGAGLWANPAGLLAVLIVAVVAGSVGGLAGLGFFLAACAGQVVDIALTDGMTRTGITATYQVLPLELRLRAQTMIEGAGVPIALGFVGVLLLVFHAFSLSVLVVTVVTTVLSLVWLLLARKAFRNYGRKLRAAVTSRPWDPRLLQIGDPASRDALWRLLDSPEPVERGLGLRTLADAGDSALPGHVARLLADPDPDQQSRGLETAARGGMTDLAPQALRIAIDPTRPGPLRADAIDTYIRLDHAGDGVAVLLEDPEPLVRAAAAAALTDAAGDLGQHALDTWRTAIGSGGEPARRALIGATASPSTRFLPDLLELAAMTTPPVDLADALAAHADQLVPVLNGLLTTASTTASTAGAERADGNTPPALLERVLRAVCQSGSPAALDVLQRCLTSDRRAVSIPAAKALVAADRTLDPTLLRPLVEVLATRAARAFAALDVLGPPSAPGLVDTAPPSALEPLRRALRDEIDSTATDVGRLVAVGHGRDMARAVAALAGGPDRGLALEALEVTLGADLARVVIPLIDPMIGDDRRRRVLARFAPRNVGDAAWWLWDIALDDEGIWQEPWLLVCALYATPAVLGGANVAFAPKWKDCDDVVVAETARWALGEVVPDRPTPREGE